MADYTKATNFTAKDSLPTGNSGKIVKGTEIDTELNAIANAIASKADINSPSLTGTPTAPTASAGTNTTQLATAAFVIAERTNTSTLTNKTVDLASNTVTGTLAQFNTACSNADFVSIAGAETLTSKTLTTPTITNPTVTTGSFSSPALTGTPTAPTASAGTNTTQVATTEFVIAERTNTATLTNKTLTSPTINTPTISTPAITGGTITGITDLAVADGGTGASTLTGVVLGNGTSAMTAVAAGTNGNVLKSNGTTWTSAAPTTVAGLGLNGETWQNVAGSRAVGSTYTNSETYPIQVLVTLVNTSGAWFYINGNLVIRQFYDVNTGAGQTGYSFVSAIIPPGSTYRAENGNLSTWYELR
jgi:hypothetical protein